MTTIVKRAGHKQEYDERKVYASIYAACLNVHIHQEEAELIADKLAKDVTSWLKDKKEITSKEIFNFVAENLQALNPEAAFMYETHRDIS